MSITRQPKSDLIFTGDSPAQFDPKFHQRAGVLYKRVQNETYERIKGMRKVELVSFCRAREGGRVLHGSLGLRNR
jgi:hypothetical protein